jgi:hypothetical protein
MIQYSSQKCKSILVSRYAHVTKKKLSASSVAAVKHHSQLTHICLPICPIFTHFYSTAHSLTAGWYPNPWIIHIIILYMNEIISHNVWILRLSKLGIQPQTCYYKCHCKAGPTVTTLVTSRHQWSPSVTVHITTTTRLHSLSAGATYIISTSLITFVPCFS